MSSPLLRFFDISIVNETSATVKFNHNKVKFFDSPHLILNSIRQLWNITMNVPQIDKSDIIIHENTSTIYDPIIKFQLTMIPQMAGPSSADMVDYTGPGWLNIMGFNIARLGCNERIKVEYRASKMTTVVGPCPYIDENDTLYVSTYHVSAYALLCDIFRRIELFIDKWVTTRELDYGLCEDDKSCQISLVNAMIFFLNDGCDIIMGHKTGHMFLDPIEVVIERGADDVRKRWDMILSL
jgi:hypothetical protein